MTPESVGLIANNLVLGKHSGKAAFADRLSALGYDLSPEQIEGLGKIFKYFFMFVLFFFEIQRNDFFF